MSRENFTAAGVPHFAAPDTPPVRTKTIRELPDWLKEQKAKWGAALQYIYRYVRENWKPGDRFFVSETIRPGTTKPNRHAGRSGVFRGTKEVGLYKMVVIDWDDEKNKILMGVTEFFRYAFKEDESES